MDKKRLILSIACFLTASVIAAILIVDWYGRNKANIKYEDLAEEVTQEEPKEEIEEETPSIIPTRNIDWDKLKSEDNEDIYAWISLPGAEVEYPILQHPEDDSFYLNNNMDGSSGYPGCIYTEKQYNTTTFDDVVTIAYGHNMRDGSMFGTLKKYRDKEFFDENRYIFVYTPDGDYAYEIFAAMEIDDRHLLHGWEFKEKGALQYYEEQIDGFSKDKVSLEDEKLTDDDRILILSTCASSSGSDRRYIVQGRLIESRDAKNPST